MPTLYALQGPDEGRTYELLDESAVIGRSSDHVHLTDNSTSRRHARIRPVGDAWVLDDLNSSNGTFLNGRRIVTSTVLQHGDQIKLGNTLLVFGGEDYVGGFTGARTIQDMVDLDLGNPSGGSSILAAVDSSEESVILQAPETADAVAAWNIVYKIAETIGATESVESFLGRVADIVFDHLIADQLVLLMYEDGSEDLIPQVVRFRSKDANRRPKIVTSKTIINHVVSAQDGVLCANAMTDHRFIGESKQDSIHRLGLRSVICVPIVAHGQVHGVMHLDCSMTHHTYTQEQLRLAVAIGRLSGLAIENAKLLESRVRTERLAATGETVAFLSHRIRNILQGMQGGSDVVELGFKQSKMETVASGWALVRGNLDRIYQLALNMLTFSKQREPSIATTQLNGIVEDVLSLVQNRTDDKDVMVLAELDDIPAVPLDGDGMHQVIHNILLNAIDAVSPRTGRVNVQTSYDSESAQVILSISDNGPGLSPEARKTMFDAFQSSKGQGGTGLGLAAARKIVRELGGEIEVESTPDEGATLRVRLSVDRVQLADSETTPCPADP